LTPDCSNFVTRLSLDLEVSPWFAQRVATARTKTTRIEAELHRWFRFFAAPCSDYSERKAKIVLTDIIASGYLVRKATSQLNEQILLFIQNT